MLVHTHSKIARETTDTLQKFEFLVPSKCTLTSGILSRLWGGVVGERERGWGVVLPKSGPKFTKFFRGCYPLRPPIMPNFIEIGQTSLEIGVGRKKNSKHTHTYRHTASWLLESRSAAREARLKIQALWANCELRKISPRQVDRRKCCKQLTGDCRQITERPFLYVTRWAWRTTSRGSVSISWDLYEIQTLMVERD